MKIYVLVAGSGGVIAAKALNRKRAFEIMQGAERDPYLTSGKTSLDLIEITANTEGIICYCAH